MRESGDDRERERQKEAMRERGRERETDELGSLALLSTSPVIRH